MAQIERDGNQPDPQGNKNRVVTVLSPGFLRFWRARTFKNSVIVHLQSRLGVKTLKANEIRVLFQATY